MKHPFTTVLAMGALLLASCGGNTQVGGIQGSGTVSGPITGFGSMFVNGVEYVTTRAQISIDDQPGTESQLKVGEVVTVTGTVNSDRKSGSATQVTFSGNVAGAVVQVNSAAGTFVVLGQTVVITGSTVFDGNIQPAGIAGLQAGTLVEVSGFPNAAGQIVASRVQLEAPGQDLQVQGTVQALDANAHTFRINTLVVDYRNVTPSGTLANGSLVKVKGSGFTPTGALLATRVQVSQGSGGAAGASADLEGIITVFNSNTDFVVNGQRVTTNASTHFDLNGVTLAVNTHIEVSGSFDSSGTLVASTVQARPDGSAMVRGLVDSPPTGNTMRVIGVTITTRATTELEDESSMKLRQFKLTDLRTGDYVEVRGTAGQSGGLDARVLVRQNPDTLSYLQGTATAVSYPTLTILGVTVTTTTQTQYTGPDGTALTAGNFFSQAPNKTVKVAGTLATGGFVASQARIVD